MAKGAGSVRGGGERRLGNLKTNQGAIQQDRDFLKRD